MLSSKEFDNKLQDDNLGELEKESQSAREVFKHLDNKKIKRDEVELKYPAFCLFDKQLRIKFPTYKIRISNNQISYDDLQKLLDGINNCIIYEESNVVEIPSLNPIQSIAVHCLGSDLNQNIRIADNIEKRLNKDNIYTQRCVTSGHYCIPINVDKEGYIEVLK